MTKIKLLGDPHLGRSFLNGTPLHRRGDREKMQWTAFEKSFEDLDGIDFHICMGDLFDKPLLPYNIIMKTALWYKKMAKFYPNTRFVILKGNHDWMRDLTSYSAFDIFAELVDDVKNIRVVVDKYFDERAGYAFFAWHPTRDLTAEAFVPSKFQYYDAFGHWDVMDIADGNINLIPTQWLAKQGVRKIYNGHIHKPKTFKRDGVDVELVGSMQPYAHGEETNDDLYVTFASLEDLESTELELRDRVVRVVLAEGETLSDELDCLHLTVIRSTQLDDDDVPDVDLGDFDMESIFLKSLSEAGVSEKVSTDLLDRYHAERAASGV